MSELVDIVNTNDEVIGSKLREELSKNDIYRVSSLWLFNEKDELLIAQRAKWKKKDPLRWTESAVGTVESGESYVETLIREAHEELGVNVEIANLIFVGKEYFSNKHSSMFGAMYIGLVENNVEIKPDTYEVPAVRWLNRTEALKEVEMYGNGDMVGGFNRFYPQVWNKLREARKSI